VSESETTLQQLENTLQKLDSIVKNRGKVKFQPLSDGDVQLVFYPEDKPDPIGAFGGTVEEAVEELEKFLERFK